MKLGRLILAVIVSLFVLFSICPATIQADDGEDDGESDNSTAIVNLTVTVVAPPSPPSGGGGGEEPSQPPVKTDIFGEKSDIPIDRKGEVQKTTTTTSPDGKLTMTIPKGTVALDKDKKPLKTLEVKTQESPPPPPAESHIIGLAYDFGPNGATFNPPITITLEYDPDSLPENVAEGDLVLAYYDETIGEWVNLECVVDTENNTITASVPHFTIFAIIGIETAPEPEPEPVPPEEPEPVPPEEPEPVPPEEPEPVPAEPTPTPEEPTPVPPEVEPEPVTPVMPEKPNWPLIIGVTIAGVLIISGICYYFFFFRKRRVH